MEYSMSHTPRVRVVDDALIPCVRHVHDHISYFFNYVTIDVLFTRSIHGVFNVVYTTGTCRERHVDTLCTTCVLTLIF